MLYVSDRGEAFTDEVTSKVLLCYIPSPPFCRCCSNRLESQVVSSVLEDRWPADVRLGAFCSAVQTGDADETQIPQKITAWYDLDIRLNNNHNIVLKERIDRYFAPFYKLFLTKST